MNIMDLKRKAITKLRTHWNGLTLECIYEITLRNSKASQYKLLKHRKIGMNEEFNKLDI